jgi:hypothetical protein
VSNTKLANRSITINGSAISLGGSVTTATLGANTYTTLQTITQANANTGILASTGYSLTGSNATNMIDLAGTWNTTGVPTALRLNMTNTASNSASRLLDLLVGGSSRVGVRVDGTIITGRSGAFSGGAALFAETSNFTICRADFANFSEVIRASLNGGSVIVGAWDGARFGTRIGFGAGISAIGGTFTTDTWLEREGANIMQQGTDANADAADQTFKSADGITGTDRSGADLTLASGRGTGAGAASALIFSTPSALSTGTTAQSLTERARITSAGLTIGSSGGSAISRVITATATLDFGSIAAQSSADLTITVTGAAAGEAVMMGLPATASTGVVFNAIVTSANTVTIRATNATASPIDPASATYRATVIQH